jgi:nucleotide-binding universal stress UspA family protein
VNGAHSPFRQRVESVAEELREAGLAADAMVLDGEPNRQLLQEAERWGANCIFLGAKGHGKISRFVIGSVSASVAARALCSVEVVRTT